MPLRSNIQETQPVAPSLPSCISKILADLGAVRLRLSVKISQSTATAGAVALVEHLVDVALPTPPVPFLTARLMVSLGMLAALASSMAYRRRRLRRGRRRRSWPPR